MKQKKLIVIGGGAAGFFTAVNAARMNPQLTVTILEKTSKLLSKVRISGGGRCNVTHACFDIPELSKKYPRGTNFVKKAFHYFFTKDTIQWFEERGVALKAEKDGRMFPVSDNSETIINCLLKEANRYGVEILMNAEVKAINVKESTDIKTFTLQYGNNLLLDADYICIACGGYPKSTQFQWLRQLGHTVSDPLPSLFTFNMPGNAVTALMGVSVEKATVKISGSRLSEEGPLLITHWGMSGPAILRLSAWGAKELADLQYKFSILVNWLPSYTEHRLRNEWNDLRQEFSGQKIGNRNPFNLPNRLWLYLLEQSETDAEQRWNDLPSKQQNKLIQNLTMQRFDVSGKTTYKEEFVTSGGISLSEVDVNTMQSKKQPGIFFAGEILNVDGITGGFNFQHAWTSGWIAALALQEKTV